MSDQQLPNHNLSFNKVLLAICSLVILSSCYTSKLKEGEYLLEKNIILLNEEDEEIDEDALSDIIKQKPNKKIFGFVRFHLLLHNSFNKENVAARKEKKLKRKNKRIRKKNIRRIKKDKDTIPYKTLKDFTTFGEKMLYTIGEPPVIVDTAKANLTAKQMNVYLIKKGYFDNSVHDSTVFYDKKFPFKRKRARTYYKIKVDEPYKIKRFEVVSKDTALYHFLQPKFEELNVKEGNVFDVDKMEKDRDQITEYLRNNGYYKFNKSSMTYKVDSSVSGKFVNITLRIAKPDAGKRESTSEFHETYTISKVQINYYQDENSENEKSYVYEDVDFFIKGELDIRTTLLYKLLAIKPGDLYSRKREQQTFRNFTGLGLFKTVNINSSVDKDVENGLVLTISLRENKKQEVRFNTSLTNTGGSNIGIEGNIVYDHKNIFRGAEKLTVALTGRLDYQYVGGQDVNPNFGVGGQTFSKISSAFNTIEFGPEVTLTLPKLLFLRAYQFENIANPKTKFKVTSNYQRRIGDTTLDYERGIQEFIYQYSWSTSKKMLHQFDPVDLSAIEVVKSEAFQDRINSTNDQLLAASFQNHIILSSRYRFTYNELLDNTGKKFYKYYSGSVETAGNTLRAYSELVDRPIDPETNSYEILGIRFAQFVKTTHDFRLYYEINDKNSFVGRVHTGLGVPLANLDEALPFIKSYFAGGTDKNRAWRARALGPGSFRDSILSFDKIGEILLEGNIEYRFDFLGFLDAAFFVDAGNIWLMNQDTLRPGAQFQLDKLYLVRCFHILLYQQILK